MLDRVKTPEANDWDRRGLPAWTYNSDAMLKLEMSELFLTHWQIAGHVNDIPNAGDYLTFDIGPERSVMVRGDDGVVRAFHNLCRHRGSRVAPDERGHCKNALVCPFHGWVYNLDGTLRGAARPKSYPELDKHEFGLRPVELEVWHGLMFIRFKSGPQPSVQELLSPFEAEIAPYYVKLAGGPDWLPAPLKTVWSYYGIFPNNVIITTPEGVIFYQELPLGPERAQVRGVSYYRPDEDRRQRLARYLGYRIDRETYAEDTQLSIWSHESMKSSAFEGFYLSDHERGVRTHHDRLRAILPIMTLDESPGGDLAAVNAAMKHKTAHQEAAD
jgi:phenylpropionate dioxygenase-like ring-hydroxylating dioxygenase large terminal subunit